MVNPELVKIFQHVFQDDDLNITATTTAADIEGWDSLMHVNLILNVEKEFAIRFTSSEVSSLESVGDLSELIQTKLSSN